MTFLEIVINAIATGIGVGFGSYFGSKMALKTELHLKTIIENGKPKQ
jgi:hypothetical protein